MTKRRAENVLPPEIPHKRYFRSFCNNDKPEGVNRIQNANESSLLLLAGQRCRKRPKYIEEPQETDNLPTKVAANNRVDSVLADKSTCKSRTFEDAGRPVVTRRSSRALQTEANKLADEENGLTSGDKVMHTDEDLSLFNSFQYWRVPLPELDLSLLDSEPSAGPHLEAMET